MASNRTPSNNEESISDEEVGNNIPSNNEESDAVEEVGNNIPSNNEESNTIEEVGDIEIASNRTSSNNEESITDEDIADIEMALNGTPSNNEESIAGEEVGNNIPSNNEESNTVEEVGDIEIASNRTSSNNEETITDEDIADIEMTSNRTPSNNEENIADEEAGNNIPSNNEESIADEDVADIVMTSNRTSSNNEESITDEDIADIEMTSNRIPSNNEESNDIEEVGDIDMASNRTSSNNEESITDEDIADIEMALNRTPSNNEESKKVGNNTPSNNEESNAVKEVGDIEIPVNDGQGPSQIPPDEEDSAEFCEGGYHRVNVEDLYLNRYRATRCLGRGHFSMVWMCWDLLLNKFVALKIAKSARSYAQTAVNEILLLKAIAAGDVTDPHRDRVLHMLNKFKIEGKHGTHIVLVFELFGTNLNLLNAETNFAGIPLSNVRTITRQVLEGLDYLHTKCKIIHTDIKPENLLIRIDEHYVTEFLNAGLAQCNSSNTQTSPDLFSEDSSENKPVQENQARKEERAPEPRGIPNPAFEECSFSVKIADLGNACWIDKHFSTVIQTPAYRSVEVILGAEYGPSADIWSTACTAFELATGNYLFFAFGDPENHLAQIIELKGEIPSELITSGRRSKVFFDEDNHLVHLKDLESWTLENQLVERYKWNPKDAQEFADFLNPMLNLDPNSRPTAAQLLQHPWLNL